MPKQVRQHSLRAQRSILGNEATCGSVEAQVYSIKFWIVEVIIVNWYAIISFGYIVNVS